MQNLVGQLIADRYRVDQFLGRGGMSEVYKVWDNNRGVYLAMKLLHDDLAHDVVFLRRFRREASTLANLQHPHIVRFYGLEQDEFLAFMLMDYVEGKDLKKEIFRHRGRGLSPRKAVDIMEPICSALGYAHQQGLVHCDLKPGNIMINKHGQVLLADFGIARMTDTATATMVGMGTPAYMAPEQVKGLGPVPQTDIYALGIVLYEMLTGGERPFTGERSTTTGTMSAKVRWEQVNLDPPSPRMYNSQISQKLETVVLKCLAKQPENRFQTSSDLLNALKWAVQGDVAPSSVPPLHKEKPLEKTSWNRWGIWAIAGGLLLTFLAILSSAKPITSSLSKSTDIFPATDTPIRTVVPHYTATFEPAVSPPELIISSTSTYTPSVSPSPTPTLTPTLDFTQTVIVLEQQATQTALANPVQTEIIGTSAGGTPLEMIIIGTGSNHIVLIGGLHGGFAPSTIELAEHIRWYYEANYDEIPSKVSLHIMINANPDSPYAPGSKSGRLNANNVDLNRNWDCEWKSNAVWRSNSISGGDYPFSEPETRALSDYLLSIQPVAVVFYEAQSPGGQVSLGGCGTQSHVSQSLANRYGAASGYRVAPFVSYALNGDATDWLDSQYIPAITVLLPDYSYSSRYWSDNYSAIKSLINHP